MREYVELPVVEVNQHGKSFLMSSMQARMLTLVSYASVRGQDQEKGAVQRVLNTRRISAIKEFTLNGGKYPASVVLNWVNETNPIQKDGEIIHLPLVERSAQLIDGQHRVAGLRAAIEERDSIGDLNIPVAIYQSLTTKECADIFLSINTEQKPVPRSLVFDLYGIADDQIIDKAAARARDIAQSLNEDEDSPYFQEIKMPGLPRRKGGIALSTAVSAIKPLLHEKGEFDLRDIRELETQKKVIKNLFQALQERYGQRWYDKNNAFMYASGFIGAIEFLRVKLLTYGHNIGGKYTKDVFFNVIDIDQNDLILQEEVKGQGGKEAPGYIMKRLNMSFNPETLSKAQVEV